MNLDTCRSICLSFKYVTEELPFGPDTLVFKVAGKMFLLVDINTYEPVDFSVKNFPERLEELRASYSAIHHAPYLNKKHWTSVLTASDLPEEIEASLIKESYQIVFDALPKKLKTELLQLGES